MAPAPMGFWGEQKNHQGSIRPPPSRVMGLELDPLGKLATFNREKNAFAARFVVKMFDISEKKLSSNL